MLFVWSTKKFKEKFLTNLIFFTSSLKRLQWLLHSVFFRDDKTWGKKRCSLVGNLYWGFFPSGNSHKEKTAISYLLPRMLKNLESKRKPLLQHVNRSCWLLEPARRADCGMSGTINSLLFLFFFWVLFWVCKKSCPGLSWWTPGDLRHCHNTQNIGCSCQKSNSGPKHARILKKFSSDFKPMLATPKKSSNPWFPSAAELQEEFGSNFSGGRNLSVVSALFLVPSHPNGDVTELNSLRCPGKP